MKFSFLQALRMVWHQKAISCLTLICFLFGCLLVFIASSYGEAFLAEVNSFDLKQRESSIFAAIHTQTEETKQTLSSGDVRRFFQGMDFVENLCVTVNVDLQSASDSRLYFSLIDPAFEDVFRYTPVAGRMFTQAEYAAASNVCVIEEDRRDRTGLRVGDQVAVGAETYEVIGVIRTMEFTNRLFLPISVEARFSEDIVGFNLVARLTDMEKASQINWRNLTRGSVNAVTATEHYRENAGFLLQLFSMVFAVGIVVFVYSLLNIYNIIVARVAARSKSIGVMMAVGAGPRAIFAQLFLETFVIMLSANLLIFLAEPLIAGALKNTLNHLFGPLTLVAMLANACVTTFAITAQLMRRARKYSITELIGGKLA